MGGGLEIINTCKMYIIQTFVGSYLQDQMTGKPFLPVLMETLDLRATSPIERQQMKQKKQTKKNSKDKRRKELETA